MGSSVKIVARPANNNLDLNLYLQVIIDRKVKKYSLEKSINKEYWDKVKSRVKPAYQNAKEFNMFLQNKLLQAEKVILELENNNQVLDLVNFDLFFSEKQDKGMFVMWVKEEIEKREYKTSKIYRNGLLAILSKLDRYAPNLKFSDVTEEFIEAYESYLFSVGNQQNTVSNNLRRIRHFVKIAQRKGLIKTDPFSNRSLKWIRTAKDTLSFEEIAKIEEKMPQMPLKIQKVVKMFLFGLYNGGLRWQDLLNLKWTSIRQEGITLVQHKTNNTVFIPFSDLGKKHLPQRFFESVYLFDRISEQKFREYLLIGMDYARIEKKVSIRTIRRSFITLSTELGMNFKATSEIAGHSSIKTTEIYAQKNSELLKREMQKWNYSNKKNAGKS